MQMKIRRFLLCLLCCFVLRPERVSAGTTGTITGTLRDEATKAVLVDVTVSAASPSGRATTKTDARGFFAIANLAPDTYVVSFSLTGYESVLSRGVTVAQDQTVVVDAALSKTLRQIGRVSARSPSSLVAPGQTADVYNVSAQQLNAAQGGDNTHKTLYNFLQTVPGVTSAGANGAARIRGGTATDTAFLYDDVPVNDRITGFFSTNNGYFATTPFSSLGVSSVQAYTGGFNARFGNADQGIVNSVISRGSYPGFAQVTIAAQAPVYGHFLEGEFGTASRDQRFSAFVGFDGSNQDFQYGTGAYSFPLAVTNGAVGPGPGVDVNLLGNFHYKPSVNDDIQFLYVNSVQRYNANYLLAGGKPVSVVPCAGYTTGPSSTNLDGVEVTAGGLSATGKPCIDTSGKLSNAHGNSSSTNPVPTGLQFVSLSPDVANNTYNYSALGKLQFNHTFSDKLSGFIRLSELFNQYVFDQPLTNPNFDGSIRPGDVALGQGQDPYQGVRSFNGSRRSQTYQLAGDSTTRRRPALRTM